MLWVVLILGAMAVFSFPPYNFYFLLPLAYFGLFYILTQIERPSKAFLIGLTFGIAYFGIGTYWLFSVLDNYQGNGVFAYLIILLAVIVFLSLYFAFFALVSVWFRQWYASHALWLVLVLPGLAVFFDWLRTWLATGFTWLLPADALSQGALEGYFPLIGSLGVGYLFYFIVALTVLWISQRSLRYFTVWLLALITIGFGSYYFKAIPFTQPTDKSISVRIIQSHFGIHDKSKKYSIVKRMRAFQYLSRLEPMAELNVWPESSVSMDYQEVFRYIKKGFSPLTQNGSEVLFGAYRRGKSGSYNTIMKASTQKSVYAKHHLMPFGEYTPNWLKKFARFLPSFPMDDLVGEQGQNTIEIKGAICAPSICYEILFGDELREAAARSNLLLHISDLGWFGSSWADPYLFGVARIRAMESRKPMIYVANQGTSAFVSFQGEADAVGTQKGTQYFQRTITPRVGVSPYDRYGNIPLFGWIVLSMFLSLVVNLQQKRRRKN